MDKKQIYVTSVLAAGLGGLFVNLLSEAIKYLVDRAWGKPLEQGQRTIIWVVALLVVGSILWVIFALILTDDFIEKAIKFLRPQFISRIRSELENEAREKVNRELEEQTGIIERFRNFKDCADHILADMRDAREVRIFLQLGRTVLYDKSPFFDCLKEIMLKPDVTVRILHASKQSRYFNEDKAQKRSSSYAQWESSFGFLANQTRLFKEQYGLRFDGRQHNEGPFWRFFIFDEVAYVQPYLYMKRNEDYAPVFKLARRMSSPKQTLEKKSLYEAFLHYFDNKWDECA
jgi:hypothetical protein